MNPVINEIMRKHGVTCSFDEFHRQVNLTFHQFESAVYDKIHRDMWCSLPREYRLLSDDILEHANISGKLRVLDIGCGTGLGSELLMQTRLSNWIGSITLLDLSPEMLGRASERAERWPYPVETLQGTIQSAAQSERFEVVLASSVLHHIPDLEAFTWNISRIQGKGDLFLHLQDPNGDSLSSPELKARMECLKGQNRRLLPRWTQRLRPGRVLRRVYRVITGKPWNTYIESVNDALLQDGILQSRMSADEVWAVTDIHIHEGGGISLAVFKDWLPDYELLTARSYGFFGKLCSELPPNLRDEEHRLSSANCMNGMYLGAVWRKAR